MYSDEEDFITRYGRDNTILLLTLKKKLDTVTWVSIFHNFEAILRPVSEIEKLATHLDVGVLRFGVLFKIKK